MAVLPLPEFFHPPFVFLGGASGGGEIRGDLGGDFGIEAEAGVCLGLALQVHLDHGDQFLGRCGGHSERGPAVFRVMGERFRLRAVEQFGGLDAGLEARQVEFARGGPLKDGEKQSVDFYGDIAPWQGVLPWRGVGIIDDLRVAANPLAGCAEGFRRAFWNRAVTAWADIKHVGAAPRDGGDQTLENGFRGLPVLIIPSEGPRVVGGVHGFPEAFHIGNRHLHVAEGTVVAESVPGAAADHGGGLVFADDGHEFLDIFLGNPAGRVEPNDFDGAVFGGDFLHLRPAFFGEVVVKCRRLALRIGGGPSAAAGECPILIVGIVESQPDPLLLAGLGKFLHGVALGGGGLDHIEVVGLRVIHRKAVVVFAGEDDVFHAGILREFGDGLGVELVGSEGGGEFLVFPDRNAGHAPVHNPLADAVAGLVFVFVGDLGIEPPVDEHRVVALFKQCASSGIVEAGLDDGFAPQFVHFLGPC